MEKNKNQITIRDPIHGQIDLFDYEVKLLDCDVFQRLRGIKQVGLTYLVYPGAQHSRFEHSIGSLYLADKFANSLAINNQNRVYLRLSALLHDLGHSCFSHDSEAVLKKELGINHEKLTKDFIKNTSIKDVLNDYSISIKKLIDFLDGKGLGSLVSFDVGADRLDYLLRDSYYTGVAYGVIEWDRIISTSKWKNNRPIIGAGGLEAAESVILARFLMFHTVYYHHTIRIARSMFQRALTIALKEKLIGLKQLKTFTDLELLVTLKNCSNKDCSFLISSILERKLFKRAAVVEWEKLNSSQKEFVKKELDKLLEAEFSNNAILILPENFSSSINLNVEDKSGKIQKLEQVSPFVSSLFESAAKKASLIICSKKDLVKKVKQKVSTWLNLD
ncbi:MAG: HD domain-containing protein [Candidatus Micrarchaeota archaeon]|nr:HD domain-containing protein [Candidatus Micrarchaeota archaeon]